MTPAMDSRSIVYPPRPIYNASRSMPWNVPLNQRPACGDDEERLMPQRTTLDAMIPREDFAREREGEGKEFVLDLFSGFPIANLAQEAPIIKLLRKPDFQRETNHWTPEQVATFIGSFLDNEVIPSLI